MKIGIIGNGFVGSAIMHGFILHVNDILVYDIDPKRSTHITAYCFLNKSDVPILFMLPEHSTKIFSTIPNKEELPYFKDKYLTLDIDIKNKLVNFFLEDEHIGVYKG